MSTANKNLPIFFILAISITLDIHLPLSACAIFCEEIKSGKTFFSFCEKAIDITFRSTFNKEMVLHFL